MKKKCYCLNLGRIKYTDALKLQKALFERVLAGTGLNYLILLEHEPVITVGRGGKKENLRVSEEQLQNSGIEVHCVERGGDVTYHGPGQIVGYPIIDLREERDIHLYVRRIEEVLIRTLMHYNIKGERIKGLTGVWVGNEKIGAIGMAVRKWISFHGFSFNVNPELKHYDLIHPCGIKDKGVTSLEKIVGVQYPSLSEVEEKIIYCFSEVFELRIEPAPVSLLKEQT